MALQVPNAAEKYGPLDVVDLGSKGEPDPILESVPFRLQALDLFAGAGAGAGAGDGEGEGEVGLQAGFADPLPRENGSGRNAVPGLFLDGGLHRLWTSGLL
ncbi:hypothetical protein ACIODT_40225 [Streptomyces sp. NPDC088251]|uniref:hypothetical protein n=1 Tax=unclassified Streptomyces TaxID=2593676 RepID=UPI0037F9E9EF